MNRRNFLKDSLSGIAAFLIPAAFYQTTKEEKKPIVLPDIGDCGNGSGSIKNIALFYEEGKYTGLYEFELPEHLRQIEAGKAIARVSSSWNVRLKNLPKPNLIKVNYLNKTC